MDDYDARAAAFTAAFASRLGNCDVISTVDFGPVIQGRLRTRGEARRNEKVVEHSEAEYPNGEYSNDKEDNSNDDDGLDMRDMVWIKRKKVHPEDVGSDISDSRMLPVMLTSKEDTVKLGWKV